MSPESTHKLMGFYMEASILGVNTMYMLFCFFRLFPIGCIGLKLVLHVCLVKDLSLTQMYLYTPSVIRGLTCNTFHETYGVNLTLIVLQKISLPLCAPTLFTHTNKKAAVADTAQSSYSTPH